MSNPLPPSPWGGVAGHEPPKENPDAKKRLPPKPGSAYEAVLRGTADVRCSLRDEHIFNLFHALGINPNCAWPPPPELEFYLREGS